MDGVGGKEVDKSKVIPSRGIPSAYALYLPPHYSKELKAFEIDGRLTKNVWYLEDIMKFLFPPQYQPRFYEVALLFLKELSKEGVLTSKEIGSFLRREKISKATFYNKVLLKIKRMGLVKVERTSNKRLRITLSKTFSNYLYKIAESWEAFVDEVRVKFR